MKNYSTWFINYKDFFKLDKFDDKLKFLIMYAILAPSSHNTQPWNFLIEGNSILIFPNHQKTLIYADRSNRELYISLGAALANLLIAAAYFNIDFQVEYLSEDDLRDPAAVVSFKESKLKGENSLKTLFPFLTKRVTNRNSYLKKDIEDNIIKELLKINNDAELTVHLVNNKNISSNIATIVKEASTFAFSDEVFKEELSEWVRTNYTKKYDGMPLFGFGIPGPLSLIGPFAIKHMIPKVQSTLDYKRAKNAAGLLVISSKASHKRIWLKVGMLYEYITLTCLKYNIATAPMAGIIEHASSSDKLRKLLNTSSIPHFFCLMGYINSKVPHSPRRQIEEVLV